MDRLFASDDEISRLQTEYNNQFVSNYNNYYQNEYSNNSQDLSQIYSRLSHLENLVNDLPNIQLYINFLQSIGLNYNEANMLLRQIKLEKELNELLDSIVDFGKDVRFIDYFADFTVIEFKSGLDLTDNIDTFDKLLDGIPNTIYLYFKLYKNNQHIFTYKQNGDKNENIMYLSYEDDDLIDTLKLNILNKNDTSKSFEVKIKPYNSDYLDFYKTDLKGLIDRMNLVFKLEYNKDDNTTNLIVIEYSIDSSFKYINKNERKVFKIDGFLLKMIHSVHCDTVGFLTDTYQPNYLDRSCLSNSHEYIEILLYQSYNKRSVNPLNDLVSISNLQSYDWINYLLTSSIKSTNYKFTLNKSLSIQSLPDIGWSVKFDPKMFLPSKIVNDDSLIIVGFYDDNRKRFNPNENKVVSFIPKQASTEITYMVSEDSGVPGISEISFNVDSQYFDLPFTVNRANLSLKQNEIINAKLRIRQKPDLFQISDLGVILDGSKYSIIPFLVSSGVIKSIEDLGKGMFRTTYNGNAFLSGILFHIKNKILKETDVFYIRYKSQMVSEQQVLIDASDILSADNSTGNIDGVYVDNDFEKDVNFTLIKYQEGKTVRQYYGTDLLPTKTKHVRYHTMTFNLKDQKMSDQYLSITSLDTKGKITKNPFHRSSFDTIIQVLYEINDDRYWDFQDSFVLFLEKPENYIWRFKNLGVVSFVDENCIDSRISAENLIIENSIDKSEFNFNASYSKDGTWSDNGYISSTTYVADATKFDSGWIDDTKEPINLVPSKSSYDSRLINVSLDKGLFMKFKIPLKFDTQETLTGETVMNDLTIDSVRLVVANGTSINFLTDTTLIELSREVMLLLNMSLKLYELINDVIKRQELIISVVNQLNLKLNQVIDYISTINTEKKSSSNILSDLLQGIMFTLDAIVPSIGVIVGVALIILVGINDIKNNDLVGGIFDVVCGVLVGGLFGYGNINKIIDYISVLNFNTNNLITNFSKFTRYLGNKINSTIYNIKGIISNSENINEEIEMLPLHSYACFNHINSTKTSDHLIFKTDTLKQINWNLANEQNLSYLNITLNRVSILFDKKKQEIPYYYEIELEITGNTISITKENIYLLNHTTNEYYILNEIKYNEIVLSHITYSRFMQLLRISVLLGNSDSYVQCVDNIVKKLMIIENSFNARNALLIQHDAKNNISRPNFLFLLFKKIDSSKLEYNRLAYLLSYAKTNIPRIFDDIML